MLYRNIVKKRFSAVAGEYEARADFQAEVAGELLSFMRRTGPLRAEAQAVSGTDNPFRVLDTGCGTGRLMRELCRYEEAAGGYKGADFFGLDMALPMLIEAGRWGRDRGGNRGLVNAACEALPFGRAVFDHVVSNLAYQWVRDLPRAFSEVERVLAPGGRFSFSTLGPATLNELHTSLEVADSGRSRFSLTPYAGIEEVADALRAAGLRTLHKHEKTMARPYDTPLHLLKTLKQTGASARGKVPEKTLSRGTFLKRVMNIYEKEFSEPNGTVRASYEVILVTAEKAK